MATVLIVEDNADIAALYERVFAQHDTHTLNSVSDAMGHLQHGCPDLLILDFHLGSDSGLRLLKYMRSTSALRDVPVLGISADDLLKDTAKQEGVTAFLAKPFRVSDLLKTAQHLITARELRPSPEMDAALREYAAAYQCYYNRPPSGQWVDGQVVIDGWVRDISWLNAEVRRLRSLTLTGAPRNYLLRLIDKLRKL